MSENHKKICKYINYVVQLLLLASTVTAYVSHSAFSSLTCVHVGMTCCPVGIKICVITSGIKKDKKIITEKKKNHD